jgi:hypothetical protein
VILCSGYARGTPGIPRALGTDRAWLSAGQPFPRPFPLDRADLVMRWTPAGLHLSSLAGASTIRYYRSLGLGDERVHLAAEREELGVVPVAVRIRCAIRNIGHHSLLSQARGGKSRRAGETARRGDLFPIIDAKDCQI